MPVISRERCPACDKLGKDTSGDNLAVYDDGHKYCFSCGYYENVLGVPGVQSSGIEIPDNCRELNPDSDPVQVLGLSVDTLNSWGLLEETKKKKNRTTGKVSLSPTGRYYWPYYDSNMRLCAYKERQDFTNHDDIYTQGKVCLTGWQTRRRVHREVVLWEGDSDSWTATELNPTRLHLCIPGVSTAEKAVRPALNTLINEFDRVYVCTDNDADGMLLRKDLLEMLPAYKTWEMTVPPQYKDLSEFYRAGGKWSSIESSSQQVKHPALLQGDSLSERFMKYVSHNQSYGNGLDTGYPGLNRLLGGGLQKGEVMMLTSHTGRGKTTFCVNIAMNISEQVKILYVPTEMSPEQTTRKCIEWYTQLPFRHDPETGTSTIPDRLMQEALEYIQDRVIFYDGENTWENIESAIEAAIHEFQVQAVIIDVLQDVDSAMGSHERVAYVMQRLNRLAQGVPARRLDSVAIVVVSHTVAKNGDYSPKLSLKDVRSGGAAIQKSTAIVGMNGEIDQEERELVLLKKSRMHDVEDPDDLRSVYVVYRYDERRYYEVLEGAKQSRDVSVGSNESHQMGVRTHNSSDDTELHPGFRTTRSGKDPGSQRVAEARRRNETAVGKATAIPAGDNSHSISVSDAEDPTPHRPDQVDGNPSDSSSVARMSRVRTRAHRLPRRRR